MKILKLPEKFVRTAHIVKVNATGQLLTGGILFVAISQQNRRLARGEIWVLFLCHGPGTERAGAERIDKI